MLSTDNWQQWPIPSDFTALQMNKVPSWLSASTILLHSNYIQFQIYYF